MADTRKKNVNWKLHVYENGSVPHHDANLAVLMDIRDELQAVNRKLDCWRIQRMFRTLERMDRRLAKKVPLR